MQWIAQLIIVLALLRVLSLTWSDPPRVREAIASFASFYCSKGTPTDLSIEFTHNNAYRLHDNQFGKLLIHDGFPLILRSLPPQTLDLHPMFIRKLELSPQAEILSFALNGVYFNKDCEKVIGAL
jgi:hypothetical protein